MFGILTEFSLHAIFSPTHIEFFTKRFIAHHIQDNFHYNLQTVQKIPELLSLTPAV